MIPALPRMTLVTFQCAWCRSFPCLCIRERPCACGGTVVALADAGSAVADHNTTAQHRAWRERRGW